MINEFKDENKNRIKQGTLLILCLLGAMWLFYFISEIFPIIKFSVGISPRDVSIFEIISILGSWLAHDSIEHIKGNSISLFTLIIFIAYIEKNPFKLIGVLIFVSGVSTWLLGSNNSLHIGASGLVYACFGYLISACFLGKRWIYLFPMIVLFFIFGRSYIYSFLQGLIPQEGISFSGHFGGLISGFFVGINYNDKTKYYFFKLKNLIFK